MPDADEKARSADTSSSSYGYPPSAPPQHQHPHQYGTFGPPSSRASGEFPQPAVGFPQPGAAARDAALPAAAAAVGVTNGFGVAHPKLEVI
ncbi:unnamed protein product [Miscanthus lutarioriparius]|uniref:Uncharacterized protein n=1 Tax=Miscanthus lutarioriparius TaxID=422564 RepID=A0A811P6A0_9POAL|nr:unnamed protein product [Miscanthus lutarioriparius]